VTNIIPEGFAEQSAGDEVELVAFTDEAGAGRLRANFGAVASVPVAPGWEEEWKRFHVPVVVGSLWLGPPWETPPADLDAVVIDLLVLPWRWLARIGPVAAPGGSG
jgi:ribosomal protein L11 methylase PrmA